MQASCCRPGLLQELCLTWSLFNTRELHTAAEAAGFPSLRVLHLCWLLPGYGHPPSEEGLESEAQRYR